MGKITISNYKIAKLAAGTSIMRSSVVVHKIARY